MTELEVSQHIPETALVEHLAASVSAPLAPCLGAMTYPHLDAPAAETEALLTGAAVHDLGWLRRIAVRGEDRFRWLSGMVTNAVETLPDNTGAYNLVLNAQGRIQGDGYVWRSGDNLELEITAEQYDPLMAHFDRFIIMDDVELVPLIGQSALGLTGPLANQILAKLGLPVLADSLTTVEATLNETPLRLVRSHDALVPHYQLWVATSRISALWQALVAAGATPVGSAALETLRIVEGTPAYGIDIQSRDLAQETAQTRALNFTKGCYLGQEIVERVRSRGQVHRHLRALELTQDSSSELPATGTELHLAASGTEAKPVGALTSVAAVQLAGLQRIFAIGMIRAEAEVGNKPLTYPGGTARILTTVPKLTPALNAAEETQ